MKPLIPWAWSGGVSTLFAYGQTGSGKTFTVSGIERHVAETLMDGGLDGDRSIYVSVTELAGQSAFGRSNFLALPLFPLFFASFSFPFPSSAFPNTYIPSFSCP